MVGYLTKYGRPKLFTFHWFVEEFASASLQLCNAWIVSDLLTCLFVGQTYWGTFGSHSWLCVSNFWIMEHGSLFF